MIYDEDESKPGTYSKSFVRDEKMRDILSDTSIDDKVTVSKMHKSINSLSGSLEKSQLDLRKQFKSLSQDVSTTAKQQEKLVKQIRMKELSSSKEVKTVEKSVQQILGKLGYTIDAFGQGSKKILKQTADTTKQTLAEYGRALSADFSVNKNNFLAMSLAKATPIFGYFAGKFMETSVFQHFSQKIKEKLGESVTFVKNKLQDTFSRISTRLSDWWNKPGKKSDKILEAAGAIIKFPFEKFKQFLDKSWTALKFIGALPFKAMKTSFKAFTDFSKFLGSLSIKAISNTFTMFAEIGKSLIKLPFKMMGQNIKRLFTGIGFLAKLPFKTIGMQLSLVAKTTKFIATLPFKAIGFAFNRFVDVLKTPWKLIGGAFGAIKEGFTGKKKEKDISTKAADSVKKVKKEKPIPKLQSGGYVTKGGMAQVHSAEVIAPVEKLQSSFTNAMEPTNKSLSEIVTFLKWTFLYGPLAIGAYKLFKGSKYSKIFSKEKNPQRKMATDLQTYAGMSLEKSDEMIKLLKNETETSKDTSKIQKKIKDATEETASRLSLGRDMLKKALSSVGTWVMLIFSFLKMKFNALLSLGTKSTAAAANATKAATAVTGAKTASTSSKILGATKTVAKGTAKVGGRFLTKGGLLSLAGVGIDAYGGVRRSKEWGTSKTAAGIGGALGGTGSGVSGAGWGALKGMSVGAVAGSATIPIVGTIIGGIVGGISGGLLGAIGGKNISKGVTASWSIIKKGKVFIKLAQNISIAIGNFATFIPRLFMKIISGILQTIYNKIPKFIKTFIPDSIENQFLKFIHTLDKMEGGFSFQPLSEKSEKAQKKSETKSTTEKVDEAKKDESKKNKINNLKKLTMFGSLFGGYEKAQKKSETKSTTEKVDEAKATPRARGESGVTEKDIANIKNTHGFTKDQIMFGYDIYQEHLKKENETRKGRSDVAIRMGELAAETKTMSTVQEKYGKSTQYGKLMDIIKSIDIRKNSNNSVTDSSSKSSMPKAKDGGIISKDGPIYAHAGEIIGPIKDVKDAILKSLLTKKEVAKMQTEHETSTASLLNESNKNFQDSALNKISSSDKQSVVLVNNISNMISSSLNNLANSMSSGGGGGIGTNQGDDDIMAILSASVS